MSGKKKSASPFSTAAKTAGHPATLAMAYVTMDWKQSVGRSNTAATISFTHLKNYAGIALPVLQGPGMQFALVPLVPFSTLQAPFS
jgi:hypothetical protein